MSIPSASTTGADRPIRSAPAIQRRRVIVASTLGNAFEWFDFTVFGLFTLVIARVFFPVQSHTTSLLFSTATLGIAFIFRPIGGIVFGLYADHVGRKAAVALMVLCMALGTALLGLIPGYATIGLAAPLLVVGARIVQGFSAGGEFAGATALLIEYAPAGRRGFYGSFQMCSQALAITLAGFSVYALSTWLSQSAFQTWGWRIPFLFGILVGPVGYYIRQRLHESPEFVAYKQAHPISTVAEFKADILDARASLLSGFGLTVAATVSFYVTFIYMPIFAVRELHLTLAEAALSTILCGLLLASLCPITGYLSDIWGRKRILIIAMIFYALMTIALTDHVLHSPVFGNYLLLEIAASLCLAFIWGPFPGAVTEAVPVGVRATGVAFIYNMSVLLFGGLAPFFITVLIAITGNPMASAYYVGGGVAISVCSYGIWGREVPVRRTIEEVGC